MLGFKGPAQPSPTLGDALNAGYLYLEVRCLGCDTHQTVALNIVRRPKATPIHELERYMRCKDCSRFAAIPTSAAIWWRSGRRKFRPLIRRRPGGRESDEHFRMLIRTGLRCAFFQGLVDSEDTVTNSLPKTREIAAAVVFDTSGRLLLQQRDDIPNILYPGKIGLFGGHREGEETFLRPSPRIVTPDRPSLPHLMATASARFRSATALDISPCSESSACTIYAIFDSTARE